MMATVRIPVAGLSRLAGALAGGGDSAYQDAFNREAEFQSKIGQALATARKSNAEADLAEQSLAARTPEAIRSNAMTTLGIPSAAAPEVEDFQRDGYIGRYELPSAQAGPTEPAPAWTKNLSNLGRAIGATQSAIALGDKSVKNLVDAQGMLNDQDLQGRIIAGVESPLAVAQAKYALKGSAPYDFNEYGVGNNLTGELDTSNPAEQRLGAVRNSDVLRNNAAATASYASAENSRASAANTRSKIGSTQTMVLPDGSVVETGGRGKPLPAAALKMQQEDLDAIGLASSIGKDLGAISSQLQNGQLQLGPFENLKSQGLNAAGFSTENSRNFASFRATLEKLRNDSLRLNKGVQTEGDAQRAWNEILANITDRRLVMQRLAEVQAINNRAADLRRNNINVIRQNYGAAPLDMRVFENLQPSIAPAAPATGGNGGWSITRE